MYGTAKKKCPGYLVGNLVATNWPIEKALHAIGYNQIPTKLPNWLGRFFLAVVYEDNPYPVSRIFLNQKQLRGREKISAACNVKTPP